MKTFIGKYRWYGSYGAYASFDYIVVANTESEALGLLLETEPKTTADDWNLEEVDTTEAGTIFVNSSSS